MGGTWAAVAPFRHAAPGVVDTPADSPYTPRHLACVTMVCALPDIEL